MVGYYKEVNHMTTGTFISPDDHSSEESPAPKYSLYILAIFDTEIPFGHSASHA
jgi:hypothetical protein